MRNPYGRMAVWPSALFLCGKPRSLVSQPPPPAPHSSRNHGEDARLIKIRRSPSACLRRVAKPSLSEKKINPRVRKFSLATCAVGFLLGSCRVPVRFSPHRSLATRYAGMETSEPQRRGPGWEAWLCGLCGRRKETQAFRGSIHQRMLPAPGAYLHDPEPLAQRR